MTAISIVAVATLVVACTANDTTFGSALRTNVALQVIDPDRAARSDAVPGGTGEGSALAAEHYRKGTVKQPVSIQTTTKATGGGSGSN
jgi:hypothetical protein